ncbi:hypothetical protein [Candidatus Nitrosocosmicus franklandus]|uniref:hypothetical protein n=1 Tax=Candidatus Nitrosocosmicus franklandianus TaxID=1798806 RepID=UPI0015584805|nr:hypothetical protein [Candidatus Nitrosocosmicus franklandus]
MNDEIFGKKDGEKKQTKKPLCIRCGSPMGQLSACHLKCLNCGAELTCSDKGNFW